MSRVRHDSAEGSRINRLCVKSRAKSRSSSWRLPCRSGR
jgi:hypothetical protein